MKLSFLAAAALAAAATFIPAPAKASELVIGIDACNYAKAGIPVKRAVVLAINNNQTFWNRLLATGASPREAGRMIGSVMHRHCPGLNSANPRRPQISKEEMAKIRARERSQQLIANRKECSQKVSAAAYNDRLRVLMSECR
jgi:hypothetical protein